MTSLSFYSDNRYSDIRPKPNRIEKRQEILVEWQLTLEHRFIFAGT